ncbi:MAG: chorismate synthase [Clostridiales bacterium]|jgi:chorismate synthase|nr:chorismate synthase [Clostridiales bacterium]
MAFICGKNFIIDIFGESHSKAMGVVINGIPAGTPIDLDEIAAFLARRRPSSAAHSTARRETDRPVVLSGLLDGRATGAPLCIIIENADARSSDYEILKSAFRPSHSDYAAYVKYGGYNDYRGGGQFSGRLTAALCAAGSVALSVLRARGVEIAAYLASVGRVRAVSYLDGGGIEGLNREKIAEMKSAVYPLLDFSYETAIIEEITAAARDGDSVGGVVECVVTGLPAGIGEPVYDGIEGSIAKLIFAIPAVKGIEFGGGFKLSEMRGSAANDAIYYEEKNPEKNTACGNSVSNPERGTACGNSVSNPERDAACGNSVSNPEKNTAYFNPASNSEKSGVCRENGLNPEKRGAQTGAKADVKTKTNNNGGITGGISNGMPILFRTAIKPVPSIAKEQDTIDAASGKNTKIVIPGRHDSCIVPRAVPVIEAAAACALVDFLL